MKADINSLKKELRRLADIDFLKKELNRIAGEIKKFDVSFPLNAPAKHRLQSLERRFHDLMKALSDLQKQVDQRLSQVLKYVKRAGGAVKKGKKKTKKKARRKAK